MAGLTAEQKRRIRKELQRRAQARMAWKMGGGTKIPSQSMKGWAGFGKDKAYKEAQLAYIQSLKTNSKWKTAYKAAAKKGGKKGKAKVETYISKKGAGATRPSPSGPAKTISKKVNPTTGTKKIDYVGNKPAPRVIKAGPKYTAAQKSWYAKHAGAGKKSKAHIKKTLDAKIRKGLL